ncbi:MAG TPA: 16S rRNA (adenine(1518)-N(6)/adenine(1519)-N(6))-dimethyltransferase RsmA [Thermoanaerobaculia bacterium]|nr:16S rRNA (adenine(1518)-N(6)/adenine(1519)-N(6))-dimethyltransferase RsmA [Thermoanaerobaculia bacterium]
MRASSGRPSRARWGQHFLVNAGTVEKILDGLGAREGDTVVEVGPGRGALTRPLLDRGVRVLAFEIDPVLAARLSLELAERALFVETADVLRSDVADALDRIGARPPVPFVGSLPYESATPMLRAFVRRPELFSRLVVMIQKEVADRIVAPPGGDAYGFLTLDISAHAAARRLFDVSRGDFSPPPKVKSSVLELVPRPPAAGADEILRVASAGFTARRKTLVNALTPLWGRERAASAVAGVGLPATARAETLGLDVFRALAAMLGQPGNSPKNVRSPVTIRRCR